MEEGKLIHGMGLWAMADQGVASAGNFATMVVLARCLAPAEYGTYAVLYGVILFLHSVHAALVTYPVSITGASAARERLQQIAGNSLLLTGALAIPLIGVARIATGIVGRVDLTLWVIAAMIGIEMQEALRRALMSHLRHHHAIFGDGITYLSPLALIFVFSRLGPIQIREVFAFIALAGVAGAGAHAVVLGLKRPSLSDTYYSVSPFWRLGKWAMGSNISNALIVQAFPWVLAWRSLVLAGTFQALANLLAFTNPVALSIGNLVVPAVAQVRAKNIGNGRSVVVKHLIEGLVILLPCYALLFVFSEPALRLFYGSKSAFLGHGGTLKLLTLGFAVAYCAQVLGAWLYGAADSVGVFITQMASSVFAVVVGLPLTFAFGLPGAALGILIVNVVRGLAILRRVGHLRTAQPPAAGGRLTACESHISP